MVGGFRRAVHSHPVAAVRLPSEYAALPRLPLLNLGVRHCLSRRVKPSGEQSKASQAGTPVDHIPLLWHVALIDGQHHITLRGATAVENNTGIDLDLLASHKPLDPSALSSKQQLGDDGAKDERGAVPECWLVRLSPREAVSLPVDFLSTRFLYLRPTFCPHDSSSFHWSDSILSDATDGPNTKRVSHTVSCTRHHRGDGGQQQQQLPFVFFLQRTADVPPCPAVSCDDPSGLTSQLLSRRKAYQDPVMYKVRPSGAMRSLLVQPVEWNVRHTNHHHRQGGGSGQGGKVLLSQGVLQPGDRVWLHQLRELRGAEFQIRLRGYQWSEWRAFLPTKTVAQDSGSSWRDQASGERRFTLAPLGMVNDCGEQLVVALELSTKPGHAPTVYLFTDFWVENLTGLPLVYGWTSGTTVHTSSKGGVGAHGGTGTPYPRPRKVQGKALGYGGRETAVVLNAEQTAESVVQEMFQLRRPHQSGWGTNDRGGGDVWCDASGCEVDPARVGEALPSSGEWVWANNWTVDRTGASQQQPLHPDGWESSSSGTFTGPGRKFRESERYWRRRWTRTRTRRRASDDESDAVSHSEDAAAYCVFQPPLLRQDSGRGHVYKRDERAKLLVKVQDSRWSPAVDVGSLQIGDGVQLTVPGGRWMVRDSSMRDSDPLYELCYEIKDAPHPWERTRVISICNRFFIYNHSRQALRIKQLSASDSRALTLEAGESMPYHWDSMHLEQLISVTCVDKSTTWGWSGGVDPNRVGAFSVAIRSTQQQEQGRRGDVAYRTLKVNISTGSGRRGVEGATEIVISDEKMSSPSHPPMVRIDNHTEWTVFFAQSGVGFGSHPCDRVAPHGRVTFGWDVPCPPKGRLESMMGLRVCLAPLEDPYSAMGGTVTTRGEAIAKLEKIGSRAWMGTVRVHTPGKTWNQSTRGPALSVITTDGPTTVVEIHQQTSQGVDDLLPPSTTTPTPAAAVLAASPRPGLPRAVGDVGAQHVRVRASVHLKRIEVSVIAHSVDERSDIGLIPTTSGDDHAKAGASRSSRLVPRELVVVTLDTIIGEVCWASLHSAVTLSASLQSLELHNHLPKTPFPVALVSVPHRALPGAQEGGTAPPFVTWKLNMCRRGSSLLHVKGFDLKAEQEIVARVDETLVYALQSFSDRLLRFRSTQLAGGSMEEPSWSLPAGGEEVVMATGTPQSFTSDWVHFDAFHISSVGVKLSVQRPHESPDNVYVGFNPGRLLLDVMMRVEAADVHFQPFHLSHTLLQSKECANAVMRHYTREVRSNVLSALGSLQALGNPLGLLRGFVEGASDAVAEPLEGFARFTEKGDFSEVATGLQRGATSFAHKTVGGVANSASLITNTLGNAGSSLALDKEYKLRRAEKRAASGNSGGAGGVGVSGSSGGRSFGLLSGLGSAGGNVVGGVVDGLSGLISGPMQGAEREGFLGGVKGAGKGVVGLIVKPVVGITDGVTDVLEGIKGTTQMIDGGLGHGQQGANTHDIRPTRAFYGRERAIRHFDREAGFASNLLWQIISKESSGSSGGSREPFGLHPEQYVDHLNLGHAVLIISTDMVRIVDYGGEQRLCLGLGEVACVETDDTGVTFHLFDPIRVRAGSESLVRHVRAREPQLRLAMQRKVQAAVEKATTES